jgi:hypothetical protein
LPINNLITKLTKEYTTPLIPLNKGGIWLIANREEQINNNPWFFALGSWLFALSRFPLKNGNQGIVNKNIFAKSA